MSIMHKNYNGIWHKGKIYLQSLSGLIFPAYDLKTLTANEKLKHLKE